MTVLKVGDTLPAGQLEYFDGDNKRTVNVEEWGKGKKIILVGIPGAFTPTCSTKHIPGFIEKSAELLKKVDAIAVLSVNDAFVMREFEKFFPNLKDSKVLLLADGTGAYTKKLDFETDLSDHGLGIRSRRFSLMADNLVVKILHLEEGGAFDNSSAEDILKEL